MMGSRYLCLLSDRCIEPALFAISVHLAEREEIGYERTVSETA